MTELKPIEYWLKEGHQYNTQRSLLEAVRKEAIQAALELAAAETTKFEYNTPIISPTTLQNKKTILSLINHPKLKV